MKKRRVGSSELHQRKIRIGPKTIKYASLFPLFDRDGSIRKLLLVQPEEGKVDLVHRTESDMSISLFNRIILSSKPLSMIRESDPSIWDLEKLWHYDPWWSLKNEKIEQTPVVQWLKQTNCADDLKRNVEDKIETMEFDIKNWKVNRIVVRRGVAGMSIDIISFKRFSQWLKSAFETQSESGSFKCKGRWVLSPYWEVITETS